MKRKGISKKTRFSVFARDNFTCVYCGQQPPQVCLEVEHVIPVCQGGTDDESNLRCSCFDCNRGKAGRTIDQSSPTESSRLAMAQEIAEQQADSEKMLTSINSLLEMKKAITSVVCQYLEAETCHKATVSRVYSLMMEFGVEKVISWMEKATDATSGYSETSFIKYVSGCARRTREQVEAKKS